MSGKEFGKAKYIDGHSDLGFQKIPVSFVAYPAYMTIFNDSNGSALFSVLWENFKYVDIDRLKKDGLDYTKSFFYSIIPLIDNSNLAETDYIGLTVMFWDEDIRRNQKVFFYTFSERKADDYKRTIIWYRDAYFREIGSNSRPEERW